MKCRINRWGLLHAYSFSRNSEPQYAELNTLVAIGPHSSDDSLIQNYLDEGAQGLDQKISLYHNDGVDEEVFLVIDRQVCLKSLQTFLANDTESRCTPTSITKMNSQEILHSLSLPPPAPDGPHPDDWTDNEEEPSLIVSFP